MVSKIIAKYKELSIIKKSAIWFTFANFLNLGISILTTPLITRLLSTHEYGEINVYQTWYNIFRIIITLNLSAGVYEVMLVDFEEDRENLTNSLITLTAILSLVGLLIFVLFNTLLTKITGLSSSLLFIMIFDIFFNTVFQFWLVKNRFVYNFKSSVILTLLISFFRTILTLVLLYYIKTNNVLLYVLGMFAPYAIVGIVLLLILFWKKGAKSNKNYWKFAIKFNIVLIPHYLSNILLSSSDKIVISKMVGNDKAGIYSLSYSVANLVSVLLTSMMLVFTPYTYNLLKSKGIKKIKEKTNTLMVIGSTCVLLLILVAPEAIRFFAPSQYLEGIYLIPPIALGLFMTFLYSLFSNIEFYYKKTKFIMFATIMSFTLNIGLNIAFIPIFGYKAAAYTTLISYIVMGFIHYIIYKRIITEPIYDIKFIVLTIIFTVFAGLSMMLLYPYFYPRLIIGLLFVTIAFIKRKKIISVFTEENNKENTSAN